MFQNCWQKLPFVIWILALKETFLVERFQFQFDIKRSVEEYRGLNVWF